jgi:trehalose 6-phosphate synthase/phosphatase
MRRSLEAAIGPVVGLGKMAARGQPKAMRGRLLIASNRLPVTLSSEGDQPRLVSSSGGLATALKGPHARMEGCWFGWPGDLSGVAHDRRPSMAAALESLGTVPVELSAKEVAHYYDGFSNGVLWPLLHYLLDKVNLDADRDWQAFRAVNERFAATIAAHHRPGDHVWVHDYHLALLPQLLRERLPGVKVGFFLHVPFPAADVFRILPWRQELLRGLLGADLVGFHTSTYARNFREAAQLVTGAQADGSDLIHEDRRVEVDVFPIGVDAPAFARAAVSAEVAQRAAEIRAAAGGKQIVLGIDRLDYTKGVPRRLLAIDRLLAEQPGLRDRVHFVQLAVPTRENVDAYADLRRNVNEMVGRINSQHGSATGAPLHLLYRSVSFTELVALYRAADVMLVTPLRDGMNLVAKEFAAARGDGGGVLVLSEFAGAAAELREALLVNPYDPAGMARTLAQALHVGAEERSRRMAALHASVTGHDVNRWSDEYLARLSACGERTATGECDESFMMRRRETLPEALERARTARADHRARL